MNRHLSRDTPYVGKHNSFVPNAYNSVPSSDGGNLIISNRELDEVAKVCRDSPACKGFNTDNWVKLVIRPFDEWETGTLKRSGCKGLFVKPDVDICRDGIPGYNFFEFFDR